MPPSSSYDVSLIDDEGKTKNDDLYVETSINQIDPPKVINGLR